MNEESDNKASLFIRGIMEERAKGKEQGNEDGESEVDDDRDLVLLKADLYNDVGTVST